MIESFAANVIVEETFGQTIVFAVIDVMLESNYTVNFYLYCLTGRRFRNEFLKVISCGRYGSYVRGGAQGQGRQVKDSANNTSTATACASTEDSIYTTEQASGPILS
jgi:hypothetical protein